MVPHNAQQLGKQSIENTLKKYTGCVQKGNMKNYTKLTQL